MSVPAKLVTIRIRVTGPTKNVGDKKFSCVNSQ
jgi:hypothetical protein